MEMLIGIVPGLVLTVMCFGFWVHGQMKILNLEKAKKELQKTLAKVGNAPTWEEARILVKQYVKED